MADGDRVVHIRQLRPFLRRHHLLEMQRDPPGRGWSDVRVLRYTLNSDVVRVMNLVTNDVHEANLLDIRPLQPRAKSTMAHVIESEHLQNPIAVLFWKFFFYLHDVWTGYELECRVGGTWREAMVVAREFDNDGVIVVYVYDIEMLMTVTLGDLRPISILLHPRIQAMRMSPSDASIWYDARVVLKEDGLYAVQGNDGEYYVDVVLLESGEQINGVPLENLRLAKKWKRGHWIMYERDVPEIILPEVILPEVLFEEVTSDEDLSEPDDDGDEPDDDEPDDDDPGDDGDDDEDDEGDLRDYDSYGDDGDYEPRSDDPDADYGDYVRESDEDYHQSEAYRDTSSSDGDGDGDGNEKRTTVTKPSSDANHEASAPRSKLSNNVSGNAREERNDLIGLAQTGYDKTGAFALPIINALFDAPQAFFACVLSPTRELAIQIAEQFRALGSSVGVKCALLVGGVDMMQQIISLAKRPRIVVLDLKAIPKERRTYFFSASMTKKVEALSKYSTVDTLVQQVHTIPAKYKDCFMVFILTEKPRTTSMVFTRTCEATRLPISGRMSQGTGYVFCFVEFEESSSMQTAIKASSVTMGGQQVFMMKKSY